MYPQQPGQQPPYPPQQGPAPLSPQPEQPIQPQGYPAPGPQQPQQGFAPMQSPDPWQLQQPQQPQPAPVAQPQTYPQPMPQAPAQPLQPNGTYNSPELPLTPDGIAPIDYLEQIAPQQKASFGFSRKQVAIAGGVILLAFLGFAIATVLQGSKPNIAALSQQVTTRVGATGFIAKNAQENLRSRELDALNSSLTIQLTNAGTGLTNAFTTAGVPVGNAKAAEADDTSVETTEKLEDARLNGVFDRVYAREMSFRLTTIMVQLDSIHKMTDNAELRTYLETTYKNLEPLQKQLEEYSASSS
ncbi:MAG TPA: hypothetical protein PKD28_01265 [Candidatus Saccharibacteria bacterium]|nr:hypothetical protein [Candidatus Saccharibacteria bacterium]